MSAYACSFQRMTEQIKGSFEVDICRIRTIVTKCLIGEEKKLNFANEERHDIYAFFQSADQSNMISTLLTSRKAVYGIATLKCSATVACSSLRQYLSIVQRLVNSRLERKNIQNTSHDETRFLIVA